jgi:hypothetical protein
MAYTDAEKRIEAATRNLPSAPVVAVSGGAAPTENSGFSNTKQVMGNSNKSGFDPDQAPESAVSAAPAIEEVAEEEPIVYPGSDPAMADGVVADGIEAFIADTVIDATGVAVVMTKEEVEQIDKKRKKKYL